jgi:hypothetical protein
MSEHEIVVSEAERSARGGLGEVATKLAERVGRHAGVRAIFGDPVERDGVTVIPVGRVRWAFGGGGGQGGPNEQQQGEGAGGGGGVMSEPVGYIEIAGGSATYRCIGQRVSPGMIVAAGLAAFLTIRGLKPLLR